MISFKARHALLSTLLSTLIATALLAGCSTTPEDRQQAVASVDSAAAFDVHQTQEGDWKTPFWERFTKNGSNNGQHQSQPAQQQQQTTRKPSFVKRDEPLGNLALIVDAAVPDSLPQTISDQAAEHGLLVLPQPLLKEAIKYGKGCQQLSSTTCQTSLAVYPGVRLLAKLTPAANGQVQVQVWDTHLHKSYQQTVSADANGASALLTGLTSQAAMAPWSIQPFPGGDGNLYISAGRVNGLAEGTELAVRTPGQAVRTPSGQVVAWHTGKVIGKAKVSKWVSATMSRITFASGVAPSADYRLTLLPKDPHQ